jgi:nicotinate-nucleotide adenylyltransferase
MKRIAFYGGTFDPPHIGHLAIAEALLDQFSLDEFVFIPAFHAPHKQRLKPTSALDRFAMLCLATADMEKVSVSKMEIELPEKPYTVETLTRLKAAHPEERIFFVMGADSWMDIRTWREWEKVLLMTDQIVVTRPGVPLETGHVTAAVKEVIVDLRDRAANEIGESPRIFLTDIVQIAVSATEIRGNIRDGNDGWQDQVPAAVAKYVQKYQIYK